MIGQALGTTHLIEGSVRKVGDRVRITAQLIEVDNGDAPLERELRPRAHRYLRDPGRHRAAIAGALRVPLGLAPGERLVANRGIDPVSYQQFFLARSLFASAGTGESHKPQIFWSRWLRAIPTMHPLGLSWRAPMPDVRQPKRLGEAPRGSKSSAQSGGGSPPGNPVGSQSCGRVSGPGRFARTVPWKTRGVRRAHIRKRSRLTPTTRSSATIQHPLLSDVGRERKRSRWRNNSTPWNPHVPTFNDDVGRDPMGKRTGRRRDRDAACP